MNCRKARMAAVERDLGLLGPGPAAKLEAHLQGCPGCAAELRAEALVVRALSELGRREPIDVDVAARVMAGVAPVAREEVPARQLGWAGAGAAVCTAIVIAALAARWQQVEALLRSGAAITSKLLGFADALATPLISLLSFLVRLVGTAAGSLADLAAQASGLAPLAWLAVALGYGLMASTVALVLLKDLRRPLTALSRGRMSR